VIFRKEFARSARDRARITSACAAFEFEVGVTILAVRDLVERDV
jgi:hypothetical protein